MLYILERLTPCRMSEKIQILSLLLKEIVRKLVCPSQTLEGNRVFFFFFSFTKKFFNLLMLGFFFFFSFISFTSFPQNRSTPRKSRWHWTSWTTLFGTGARKDRNPVLLSGYADSATAPSSKPVDNGYVYTSRISIEKIHFQSSLNPRIDCFSASLISRISQGTFCCEEAFKFNNIRIEWVLRQSISVSLTISLLPFRYDSFEIRALFRRHLGILSHTYTLF